MLNFLLTRRNLARRKMRTLMTVIVVALAFLLFALLGAVKQGIDGSVEISGADRLITVPAVSGNRGMPKSYADTIAAIPGIASVAFATHVSAYFQEEKNSFRVAGVDLDKFLSTYPEILVPADQLQNFLKDRRAAMVGKTLAARMGWKIGDNIPFHSTSEMNVDGSNVWNVKIAAIYDTSTGGINTSAMAVHYEFINESRVNSRDTVDYIVSRVANSSDLDAIANAIDAKFQSSPLTRTTQEKADAVNQIRQIGNLGSMMLQISIAVFFSMLLVTIGVMIQAVRERTIEISVMRALGFQRSRITAMIVGESMLITLIGGLLGLGLACAIVNAIRPDLATYLEAFRMPDSIVIASILLAMFFGFVAAIFPAFFITNLKITDGLRDE